MHYSPDEAETNIKALLSRLTDDCQSGYIDEADLLVFQQAVIALNGHYVLEPDIEVHFTKMRQIILRYEPYCLSSWMGWAFLQGLINHCLLLSFLGYFIPSLLSLGVFLPLLLGGALFQAVFRAHALAKSSAMMRLKSFETYFNEQLTIEAVNSEKYLQKSLDRLHYVPMLRHTIRPSLEILKEAMVSAFSSENLSRHGIIVLKKKLDELVDEICLGNKECLPQRMAEVRSLFQDNLTNAYRFTRVLIVCAVGFSFLSIGIHLCASFSLAYLAQTTFYAFLGSIKLISLGLFVDLGLSMVTKAATKEANTNFAKRSLKFFTEHPNYRYECSSKDFYDEFRGKDYVPQSKQELVNQLGMIVFTDSTIDIDSEATILSILASYQEKNQNLTEEDIKNMLGMVINFGAGAVSSQPVCLALNIDIRGSEYDSNQAFLFGLAKKSLSLSRLSDKQIETQDAAQLAAQLESELESECCNEETEDEQDGEAGLFLHGLAFVL